MVAFVRMVWRSDMETKNQRDIGYFWARERERGGAKGKRRERGGGGEVRGRGREKDGRQCMES